MGSEPTRKEKYLAYLATPKWKEKRREALERAEHRCQVCNTAKRLDAHHRTYQRFEEERIGDLTVLCRRCHDLFHEKGKLRGPKHKPEHVKQAKAIKKRRRRQKRAAKRWAERPSTAARRQELAAQVLREQKETNLDDL